MTAFIPEPSLSRRRFIGAAAAVASSSMFSASVSAENNEGTTPMPLEGTDGVKLRPFHVHATDSALADMRRRIKATRWPERETVANDSQGVPLAMMQEFANHWATDYDWRECEARLNSYPQYLTEVDGLDIHFLHVRSPNKDAMPLIVTHGWPGSVIEQFKIIELLSNPSANGAHESDAFHLVVPSLPGYGFSGKPSASGWGPERTGRAWVTLMRRLGYSRFAAQGGDLGGIVANVMGKQAPPELMGIHVNYPATVPAEIVKALQAGDAPPASLSADEKHAYEQLSSAAKMRRAYALEMGTRPQTLYGVADSPIGLAGWLLDHGDGYTQPAAALTSAVFGHDINDESSGALTRNDVLDDITLYWLTNTGVSAARFYWESHFNFVAASEATVPAAVSVFPREIYQAPRSWTERAYHNLIYYNRPDKGGHFAAWEQPALFANEVRAGLRSLRS